MIDLFVLLTPILLLGLVALLGFLGCQFDPSAVAKILTISPNSGPITGGTVVTITGSITDFASNVTVKFGTAVASGNISSQTVVTAVTPSQAVMGQVDVEVEYVNSQGSKSSVSLQNGFTYYNAVVPLSAQLSKKAGGSTNQASLPPLFSGPQPKLVVVTVEWGAGGTPPATLKALTSPGVTYGQVGTTDFLNPQQVATFFQFVDLSSGLTVTATLNGTSTTDFNLLVSAYDNAASSAPIPVLRLQGVGINPPPSLSFPTTGLGLGDLLYALAIARTGGGALAGAWSPGSGFIAEAGQNGYLLLEDYLLQQKDLDAGNVNVTASDANGTASSNWYLFSMAIKNV